MSIDKGAPPQRRTANPREIYQLERDPGLTITNLGWRQVEYDPDPRLENYIQPDDPPYFVGRPVYIARRVDPLAPPEPDPYPGFDGVRRRIQDREYDKELQLRYPLPPEQEEERAASVHKLFPGLKFK